MQNIHSHPSTPWDINTDSVVEEVKKFTHKRYNKPITNIREKIESFSAIESASTVPAFYSHVIKTTPEENKKIYDASIPGNIHSFKLHQFR